MKYKIGDLVRIKSKAWWDKQPKDKDGDASLGNTRIVYFTKYMADECCDRIGEIREIIENSQSHYEIDFGHDWWNFHRSWIKEKVEKINITLWHMKNEI